MICIAKPIRLYSGRFYNIHLILPIIVSPTKITTTTSSSGNIIIVDEVPKICANLTTFFETEGFGVYICRDVVELMTVEHKNLRLILMDVSNGETQGIELVRQSKVGANLPIIICSDIPSTDDIIRGLNAGADDYILKPYSTRELIARVRALIRRAG